VNNVTISIVTFTELDRAKACIESVLRTTSGAKLILTANRNPKAADYFRTVPGAIVIEHAENIGFGRAHNRAFEKCETEFFLCLNDDATVYGEWWLAKLMRPLTWEISAALSCPADTCSELRSDFGGRKGMRREYCEGSCLLVKSEVAKEHGLFDETLPGLCYCEDSDLSLRYRELGYSLHWVDVMVVHEGASTSKRMLPVVREWQKKNMAFMQKRWAKYLSNPLRKFPSE
jgi:GT2 family glycosyltransferase